MDEVHWIWSAMAAIGIITTTFVGSWAICWVVDQIASLRRDRKRLIELLESKQAKVNA